MVDKVILRTILIWRDWAQSITRGVICSKENVAGKHRWPQMTIQKIVLLYYTSLHGDHQQSTDDHKSHHEQLAERHSMSPRHLRSAASLDSPSCLTCAGSEGLIYTISKEKKGLIYIPHDSKRVPSGIQFNNGSQKHRSLTWMGGWEHRFHKIHS